MVIYKVPCLRYANTTASNWEFVQNGPNTNGEWTAEERVAMTTNFRAIKASFKDGFHRLGR